jgi:hypothetical protein
MTSMANRVAARLVNVGGLMEGDAAYFGRRAREEREAAMRAAHPAAQHAHLEMARRYDDLGTAIASSESRPTLVIPFRRRSSR